MEPTFSLTWKLTPMKACISIKTLVPTRKSIEGKIGASPASVNTDLAAIRSREQNQVLDYASLKHSYQT